MGFQQVTDLDAETTISLGGYNKKTKRDNPTSVEGYYLGNRQVKNKNGFSTIYFFQTSKGNVGVWGKTDLDNKMKTVDLGTMVRASFSKMVPTPKGDMYKYVVEFDPDNTIEVSELSAGADSISDDTSTIEDTDVVDESDEVDEDALQAAALQAAERKAKVEALLSRGKTGKTAKG